MIEQNERTKNERILLQMLPIYSSFWPKLTHEQAVRVATRYAPAPLLPRGSASRAAEQTQRSSSFPHPIRSHGHRYTCLMR